MQVFDNAQYSAYNAVPCGIVIFHTEPPFNIVYANDIYYNDFAGSNKNELNIYHSDFELFYNTLKQRTKDFSEDTLIDYRIETSAGLLRWIRMIASVQSESGTLLAVLSDVTTQHNMFNMLERERKRYAVAISSSHDIIFEYDVPTDVCSIFIPNPNGGDPKTYEFENFRSMIKSRELIHPDDIPLLFGDEENSINDGVQFRIKTSEKDKWMWYQLHCSYTHDEFGKKSKAIGSLHNIESIKKEEEQLKSKIEIDPLSKVYTRAAAVEKIEAILSKEPEYEYALFIIDLDNFKSINDTYGHLYGDAVISMLAGCIKSSVKDSDIIGRFGGDEFFAFVSEKSSDDIIKMAKQIVKSVFNLCKNIEHKSTLSCSVGVALKCDFPDKPDFDTMLHAADKALYQAKKNGKNQYMIYDAEYSYDADASETVYTHAEINDNISSSGGNITAMALEIIAKSKSTDNAVATLLRHIGSQFNLDFIQIMNIDCTTDMVSLDHEWSRDSNFVNTSSRMGYYIHSDIERLKNIFNKSGFFILSPDIIDGFSPKFTFEFNKLSDKKVIYCAAINNERSFNMIVYQCFDSNHEWSEEELETLFEVTKLLSVYIGNPHAPSAREKYLQEILDHDPLTGLYTRKKFYEMYGLIRKQSEECHDSVFIAHCDFADFNGFNRTYGYTPGNEIIIHFASMISEYFPEENTIAARCEESEKYLIMTHATEVSEFMSTLERLCKLFTEKYNPRFPEHPLVIKTGITKINQNEWLVKSIDRIKQYKKLIKNPKENQIFYIE